MKIVQTTYTGFGGLGSVVFSLITSDQAEKHNWQVAFIGDQELDASYPIRCKKHGVDYAAFRTNPGRPYRAWIALARWLAKKRPEVVICHSSTSILACRWYAWLHRAKLIAVEHMANQVKSRNEWAASRMCMLLADKVVVLTEEYRNELQMAYGRLFRTKKVLVIPNGIDTDVFYPKAAHETRKKTRIRLGMAARFSFSKRQDLLIAVMERLAELHTQFYFELVLAGDGSEFESVKKQAEASPVASQVSFEGLLSENDIAPWLRELDIYVHATEGETLSTSLLQAMATGLPVIASDIPGVKNLLGSPEQYGICVRNEVETFTQAVFRLVNEPDLASVLGRSARERVVITYSSTVMLKSYLDLIDKVKK
jgi:glycosyltransferase involved in cell wall biosynthesis